MSIMMWLVFIVWIAAGIALGYIMGFSKSVGAEIVLLNNMACLVFVIVGMAVKYFWGK